MRSGSGALRVRHLLVSVAIVLCSLTAAAFGADVPVSRLRAALSDLPHRTTRVSACVVDLATGETVFEQDADTVLVPASTLKVFVAAVAVAKLGPEYAFETRLATDGTNLYLIGAGDPGLGDPRIAKKRGESITAPFDRFAQVMKDQGITSVPGRLIIDESVFDSQRLHPDWEEADLGKWYTAPVGALNINDNCLDISVIPGGKAGAPTEVHVVPPAPLVNVINRCKTGGRHKALLHHPPGTFDYKISGRCTKRWAFEPVAFPDPGLLTASTLRSCLGGHGVSVAGATERGSATKPNGGLVDGLTVIARHQTPLSDVLGRMGRNSQNLFAECLLKRLGHEWLAYNKASNQQGTWMVGAEAIVRVLKEAGVDTTGLVVRDGSGLSRKNRCSARHLVETLAWINRDVAARMFRDSLSISGVDGSLQKQLRNHPGRVLGKTGTMKRARSLAGFVMKGDRPAYAFAIMFNDYKGGSWPYRKIQDDFCELLIRATDR